MANYQKHLAQLGRTVAVDLSSKGWTPPPQADAILWGDQVARPPSGLETAPTIPNIPEVVVVLKGSDCPSSHLITMFHLDKKVLCLKL